MIKDDVDVENDGVEEEEDDDDDDDDDDDVKDHDVENGDVDKEQRHIGPHFVRACAAYIHGNMSQERFFYENLQETCRSPEPRPTFFASQCSRNPRQHVTRASLWKSTGKVPWLRDVTQIVPVQDVKKKHSCENSFKNRNVRYENDALVVRHPSKK